MSLTSYRTAPPRVTDFPRRVRYAMRTPEMTSRPYPAVVANHNQPAEPRVRIGEMRKS